MPTLSPRTQRGGDARKEGGGKGEGLRGRSAILFIEKALAERLTVRGKIVLCSVKSRGPCVRGEVTTPKPHGRGGQDSAPPA